MLSRLLRSARGVTKSGTKQEGELAGSDNQPKNPVAQPTMVTTRGQSGRSGVTEVDEWEISTPSAQLRKEALRTKTPIPSTRKRRLDEVSATKQDTASASPDSASKKQKKLPLRKKDGQHSEVHNHLAVEIPIGDFDPSEYTKVVDPEEAEPTQSTQTTVPRDTPSKTPAQGHTVKSKTESPKGAAKPSVKSDIVQISSESGGDSNEGSEEEAAEESVKKPTVSQKQTQPKKSPKAMATGKTALKPHLDHEPVTKKPITHKRFGSEDAPDPALLALAKTVGQKTEVQETGSEEEEEDEEEDDAPEVVETQAAQEAARSRAREVARAAEE